MSTENYHFSQMKKYNIFHGQVFIILVDFYYCLSGKQYLPFGLIVLGHVKISRPWYLFSFLVWISDLLPTFRTLNKFGRNMGCSVVGFNGHFYADELFENFCMLMGVTEIHLSFYFDISLLFSNGHVNDNDFKIKLPRLNIFYSFFYFQCIL